MFNPLNAELNPICHLPALLGAHRILHVGRIRVNYSHNICVCVYIHMYIYMLGYECVW
jgi:hypothetical protein